MLRASIREDLRNYPNIYFEKRYSNATSDDKKTKWLYIKIAAAMYKESRGSRDISEIIGGLSKLNSELICPKLGLQLCRQSLGEMQNAAKTYWLLSENLRQLRNNLKQDIDGDKVLRFAIVGALNAMNRGSWGNAQNLEAKKIFEYISLFDKIQSYRTQIENLQPQDAPDLNAERLYRFSAAMTGINVLCQIANTKSLSVLQTTTGLAKAIIDEDYSRLIIEIFAFENGSSEAPSYNKYLPLMVELASANSAEDMQKIFELATAPVGSYREKFKSNLTSITAMAGVALTQEQLDISNAPSRTISLQPFLPIGVQHTWKPEDNSGVPGLFISLVDIGAFAISRQGNGTVSSSSNASWGQVFSPGVYFTYNLASAHPIVFGIGASRTPQLVTTSTGDQVTSNRFQAFIAIDLTLFSFH